MSTKVKELEAEQLQTALVVPANRNEDIERILKPDFLQSVKSRLENAKTAKRGVDLTPQIWAPEVGEVLTGVIFGTQLLMGDDGPYEVVTLLSSVEVADQEGVLTEKMRLIAVSGVVVVNKCKDLGEDVLVDITFRGKEKSKKGKEYGVFEVETVDA